MPVTGKPKPVVIGPRRFTAVPLGWVESGLGRKSGFCEGEGNLGQRRRTRVVPAKLEGPERRYESCLQVAGRGATPVQPTKSQSKRLGMNVN